MPSTHYSSQNWDDGFEVRRGGQVAEILRATPLATVIKSLKDEQWDAIITDALEVTRPITTVIPEVIEVSDEEEDANHSRYVFNPTEWHDAAIDACENEPKDDAELTSAKIADFDGNDERVHGADMPDGFEIGDSTVPQAVDDQSEEEAPAAESDEMDADMDGEEGFEDAESHPGMCYTIIGV